MLKILVIGLGGFVGAVSRYGVGVAVHRHLDTSFPYGTFVVNFLGCLVLGGLLHWGTERAALSPHWHLFLTIGVLGAFTTFSTFGYETVGLLQSARWTAAGLNVVGNVLLGLSAVWLGRAGLRALGV